MSKEDERIIENLLPHVPIYYRVIILAWLNHHNFLVNASNVRSLYSYMLGHISYDQLMNHFKSDI